VTMGGALQPVEPAGQHVGNYGCDSQATASMPADRCPVTRAPAAAQFSHYRALLPPVGERAIGAVLGVSTTRGRAEFCAASSVRLSAPVDSLDFA
jgi:hypothetical protein